MPTFGDAGSLTLTAAQAEAVAEFLQSLAPVVNNVDGTTCPLPGSTPPVSDAGDASTEDASVVDASSADASTEDAAVTDAGSDAPIPDMDAASDAAGE
jgi:hypothetical protein